MKILSIILLVLTITIGFYAHGGNTGHNNSMQ